MEEQNIQKEESGQNEISWQDIEKSHRRGKVMGGLLIVAIGSLFLARELGAEIPFWLFSWKTLLIGLGLVLAVKHKFMHPGWIILMAIGGTFLLTDIYPEMHIKPILWPSLIILVGLMIIFKPRRKRSIHYKKRWQKYQEQHKQYHKKYHERYEDYCNTGEGEPTNDDYLDSTVIMAGVKKNILTKNFKGGDVTNVFGGSELNMSQADFEGQVKLEITQVFGGTKLIVPANWEVRSEQTVTMFGSVEDKRTIQPNSTTDPNKVLIITGTTVFGGIDIRSY